MAKSNDKSQTKVTRIKASDDKPAKSKAATKKVATENVTKKDEVSEEQPKKRGILSRIGGYFKGSWEELSQVRWPDRATTWKMTGALIAFTLFFVALILLLDTGFKYLSEFLIRR